MPVEVNRARSLGDIPHGFLGRIGGVSTGIYAGLNCSLGSSDDRAAVIENRNRAIDAIYPGAKLCRVYQYHSADVVLAENALSIATLEQQDNPPKADAMVSNRPGLLLGVQTADCVPILFADHRAGVIGAAHSGWKGSIGGISENVIAAMERLGASRDNIVCAVGPCIAQKSYEVDDSFLSHFAKADPDNERFFTGGKTGHHQFDMEGYVASRIATAGVRHIECLGQDTYSQPKRFFSYRRSCHLNEGDYGAQMSLIGLPL
jgi:polyphenol oxidase